MDGHEQVGLHALGLLHAFAQRHEEVGVAREQHAHAGLGVEALAQLQRHRQHHVLFLQAGGPDRAGILAAVAGIDGDHQQAVDLALFLGRERARGERRLRLHRRGVGAAQRRVAGVGQAACGGARPRSSGRAGAARDLADELAERVLHGLRGRLLGLLLAAQQREQRILLLDRVEVEHEPVLVGRDRRQHELLRGDGLLQVQHQAHHARLVLAHAHAGDERVVGAHLAHHVAQGRAQLEVVDVDDEAVRVVGDEVARHQRLVGLDRDAGVVGRGPDADGDDGGAEHEVGGAQPQHEAATAEQRISSLHEPIFSSNCRPMGVIASNRTPRMVPSCGVMVTRRSGTGSRGSAFAAHSTSFRPGAPNRSRRPASSHSCGSSKR
jgi:hypothetical protein